jgi:A/G-specific adenine glycosylase
MDYGAMQKKVEQNPNRRSAHYHRQAPFHDSDRQVRGLILKILLESPDLAEKDLVKAVGKRGPRVRTITGRLVEEGLLERTGERVHIASSVTCSTDVRAVK